MYISEQLKRIIWCMLGSKIMVQFSRSVVSDSATSWTAAHQASLSITNSQSLFKLVSIESVMPIQPSHPLSSPSPPSSNILIFDNVLLLPLETGFIRNR